jgi:hypothetical protein
MRLFPPIEFLRFGKRQDYNFPRRNTMWPLSIFLFTALAFSQQKPLGVSQDFHHLKLPTVQNRQVDDATSRKLSEESRRNT